MLMPTYLLVFSQSCLKIKSALLPQWSRGHVGTQMVFSPSNRRIPHLLCKKWGVRGVCFLFSLLLCIAVNYMKLCHNKGYQYSEKPRLSCQKNWAREF